MSQSVELSKVIDWRNILNSFFGVPNKYVAEPGLKTTDTHRREI